MDNGTKKKIMVPGLDLTALEKKEQMIRIYLHSVGQVKHQFNMEKQVLNPVAQITQTGLQGGAKI